MWRRFSEEERQTVWDMREAGVPVKRIARHLGRQPVSLRKFIASPGGSARRHENAVRCGCHCPSARRSPVVWPQGGPCGQSRRIWWP